MRTLPGPASRTFSATGCHAACAATDPPVVLFHRTLGAIPRALSDCADIQKFSKEEQGTIELAQMRRRHSLVLFQCDIDGFSTPVVFRRKAPCAGNGPALIKHGNAAAGHHRRARRVGLSASTAALHLLPKATTLRFEPRLALNADRPGGNLTH
jgi:hypothetical protein